VIFRKDLIMKKTRESAVLIAVSFIAGTIYAQVPSDQESDRAKRDDLVAAIQTICPVTGEKLGKHGNPVKVRIGKEEVFLCCKSCAKGKIDAKHWATIHANFAKAQKSCPVMKKPLPEKAKWTIVDGRIVYVCCPPCTSKIEADPDKFLKIVDDAYASFLKEKQ
jgi:hypothetical protein